MMIGRFPEGEVGFEAEGFWALTVCGKPSDKEPATAVERKSRRETVICPPLKVNAGKRLPE
jgi:hypothetical protein